MTLISADTSPKKPWVPEVGQFVQVVGQRKANTEHESWLACILDVIHAQEPCQTQLDVIWFWKNSEVQVRYGLADNASNKSKKTSKADAAPSAPDAYAPCPPELEERHVFLSLDKAQWRNTIDLSTVLSSDNPVVRVAFVWPGCRPPPLKVCDFWFSQSYTNEFRRTQDIYLDLTPQEQALAAVSAMPLGVITALDGVVLPMKYLVEQHHGKWGQWRLHGTPGAIRAAGQAGAAAAAGPPAASPPGLSGLSPIAATMAQTAAALGPGGAEAIAVATQVAVAAADVAGPVVDGAGAGPGAAEAAELSSASTITLSGAVPVSPRHSSRLRAKAGMLSSKACSEDVVEVLPSNTGRMDAGANRGCAIDLTDDDPPPSAGAAGSAAGPGSGRSRAQAARGGAGGRGAASPVSGGRGRGRGADSTRMLFSRRLSGDAGGSEQVLRQTASTGLNAVAASPLAAPSATAGAVPTAAAPGASSVPVQLLRSVPAPGSTAAATGPPSAAEGCQDPRRVDKTGRAMSILELCCGAGGLSGMATTSGGKHASLQTQWAVDINMNACLTYKANHPDTHVWCMGLDEFYYLLLLFDRLTQQMDKVWPDGAVSCSEEEGDEESSYRQRQKGLQQLWDQKRRREDRWRQLLQQGQQAQSQPPQARRATHGRGRSRSQSRTVTQSQMQAHRQQQQHDDQQQQLQAADTEAESPKLVTDKQQQSLQTPGASPVHQAGQEQGQLGAQGHGTLQEQRQELPLGLELQQAVGLGCPEQQQLGGPGSPAQQLQQQQQGGARLGVPGSLLPCGGEGSVADEADEKTAATVTTFKGPAGMDVEVQGRGCTDGLVGGAGRSPLRSLGAGSEGCRAEVCGSDTDGEVELDLMLIDSGDEEGGCGNRELAAGDSDAGVSVDGKTERPHVKASASAGGCGGDIVGASGAAGLEGLASMPAVEAETAASPLRLRIKAVLEDGLAQYCQGPEGEGEAGEGEGDGLHGRWLRSARKRAAEAQKHVAVDGDGPAASGSEPQRPKAKAKAARAAPTPASNAGKRRRRGTLSGIRRAPRLKKLKVEEVHEDADCEIVEGPASKETYYVEDIINVRLQVADTAEGEHPYGMVVKSGSLAGKTVFLRFLVQWAGDWHENDALEDNKRKWTWEPQELLEGSGEQLAHFVRRWNRMRVIPRPADGADLIVAGGPPCQGMSGLNANAKRENILSDAKNRLIEPYMDIVEFLRPANQVTEQVTDAAKKEQGRWFDYALGRLRAMQYQAAVHVVPAGGYGVPTGRYRVIIIAARQGEMAHTYPFPSHQACAFDTGITKGLETCYVYDKEHIPHVSEYGLWPMLLTGDALSDLPPCRLVGLGTVLQYSQNPQYIYQQYLRRAPPAGTPSLEQRALQVELGTNAHIRAFARTVLAMAKYGDAGLEAIGRRMDGQHVQFEKKLQALKETENLSGTEEEEAKVAGVDFGGMVDWKDCLKAAVSGKRAQAKQVEMIDVAADEEGSQNTELEVEEEAEEAEGAEELSEEAAVNDGAEEGVSEPGGSTQPGKSGPTGKGQLTAAEKARSTVRNDWLYLRAHLRSLTPDEREKKLQKWADDQREFMIAHGKLHAEEAQRVLQAYDEVMAGRGWLQGTANAAAAAEGPGGSAAGGSTGQGLASGAAEGMAPRLRAQPSTRTAMTEHVASAACGAAAQGGSEFSAAEGTACMTREQPAADTAVKVQAGAATLQCPPVGAAEGMPPQAVPQPLGGMASTNIAAGSDAVESTAAADMMEGAAAGSGACVVADAAADFGTGMLAFQGLADAAAMAGCNGAGPAQDAAHQQQCVASGAAAHGSRSTANPESPDAMVVDTAESPHAAALAAVDTVLAAAGDSTPPSVADAATLAAAAATVASAAATLGPCATAAEVPVTIDTGMTAAAAAAPAPAPLASHSAPAADLPEHVQTVAAQLTAEHGSNPAAGAAAAPGQSQDPSAQHCLHAPSAPGDSSGAPCPFTAAASPANEPATQLGLLGEAQAAASAAAAAPTGAGMPDVAASAANTLDSGALAGGLQRYDAAGSTTPAAQLPASTGLSDAARGELACDCAAGTSIAARSAGGHATDALISGPCASAVAVTEGGVAAPAAAITAPHVLAIMPVIATAGPAVQRAHVQPAIAMPAEAGPANATAGPPCGGPVAGGPPQCASSEPEGTRVEAEATGAQFCSLVPCKQQSVCAQAPAPAAAAGGTAQRPEITAPTEPACGAEFLSGPAPSVPALTPAAVLAMPPSIADPALIPPAGTSSAPAAQAACAGMDSSCAPAVQTPCAGLGSAPPAPGLSTDAAPVLAAASADASGQRQSSTSAATSQGGSARAQRQSLRLQQLNQASGAVVAMPAATGSRDHRTPVCGTPVCSTPDRGTPDRGTPVHGASGPTGVSQQAGTKRARQPLSRRIDAYDSWRQGGKAAWWPACVPAPPPPGSAPAAHPNARPLREAVLLNHIALPHNGSDFLRSLMVQPGGSYKDFPGAYTNPMTKRTCVAHQHAMGCGGAENGCKATATWWLPQGRPVVLRSNVRFKMEQPSKRFTPWGRVDAKKIVPTLLGYTGAAALALLHPEQPRIVTVAENKRLQGLPDFYALTTRPPSAAAADAWPGIALARKEPDSSVDAAGKLVKHQGPPDGGQLVSMLSDCAAVPHSMLLADLTARAADPRLRLQPSAGPGLKKGLVEEGKTNVPPKVYPILEQGQDPQQVLMEALRWEALAAAAQEQEPCTLQGLAARLRQQRAALLRAVQAQYTMVGNSVAYPVAAAVGRCISLAAAGHVPQDRHPSKLGHMLTDPDWRIADIEGRRKGLRNYYDTLPAKERPSPHGAG